MGWIIDGEGLVMLNQCLDNAYNSLPEQPGFTIVKIAPSIEEVNLLDLVPSKIFREYPKKRIWVHIDAIAHLKLIGYPQRGVLLYHKGQFVDTKSFMINHFNQSITKKLRHECREVIRDSVTYNMVWELTESAKTSSFWNNEHMVKDLVVSFMTYHRHIPDNVLLKITTTKRALKYAIDTLLEYNWFSDKLVRKMPGQQNVNLADEIILLHQDKFLTSRVWIYSTPRLYFGDYIRDHLNQSRLS